MSRNLSSIAADNTRGSVSNMDHSISDESLARHAIKNLMRWLAPCCSFQNSKTVTNIFKRTATWSQSMYAWSWSYILFSGKEICYVKLHTPFHMNVLDSSQNLSLRVIFMIAKSGNDDSGNRPLTRATEVVVVQYAVLVRRYPIKHTPV